MLHLIVVANDSPLLTKAIIEALALYIRVPGPTPIAPPLKPLILHKKVVAARNKHYNEYNKLQKRGGTA